MKQAQKVALECDDEYMEVMFDLSIARVALQIQASEKPSFDNLFIQVGTFHVMMAYFKAVGKFIDNCGLTTIMVNSELLARGAVNSFISRNHFNTCKRLHSVLSDSIQIWNFNSFLELLNLQFTDEMKNCLINFK